MEGVSKRKLILLQVFGELAFALVALPIYVLMVLPNATEGSLPGFVPVCNTEFGLINSLILSLGVLVISLFAIKLAIRYVSPEKLIVDEVKDLAKNFTLLELAPVYLAAGIGEELLFRVVCIDLFGLLIASALFALVHVAYWKKPLMLLAVFVLALLLGGLYVLTESFLMCALVHFAYNLLVTKEVRAQVDDQPPGRYVMDRQEFMALESPQKAEVLNAFIAEGKSK